ncbi:sensor histidine kinase [Candidatus Frankia nodulisporulans]|nr:histidine kinase [Candidatus Frankia nodulisporulans]
MADAARRTARWAAEVLRLVVAAAVVIGGSAGASHDVESGRQLDTAAFVLLGLLTGTVLLRERSPLMMVAVAAPVLGGYLGAGYPHGPSFAPLVVALLSLGLHRDHRTAWWAAGGAAVLVLAGTTVAAVRQEPASGWGWSVRVLVVVLVCGVPTLIGILLRGGRGAAARAKEEATLRRIEQERLRLAREVHDVVGHSLSVISLRAAVALHVLDRRPEQAQLALEAIRRTSVDALEELRATLTLSRAGTLSRVGPLSPSLSPATAPAPAPAATAAAAGPGGPGTSEPRASEMDAPAPPLTGLRRLSSLVDEVRLCGIPVDLRLGGVPEQLEHLPLDVDLAAFRIIQESLTNVLRHTARGTTRVEVVVTLAEQRLTLEVVDHVLDQIPPVVDDVAPVGHGLTGLRERTAELGGTMSAGPVADGWRVHAVLPARAQPHSGAPALAAPQPGAPQPGARPVEAAPRRRGVS